MSFDYEQSIWGKGEASLRWNDPTSFRLQQALLAIKNLPSGSRVLEVGCGAGQFIRAVKKNRQELDCFGCDISQKAIEIAEGRGKREEEGRGVQYSLSAVERLPYDDGNFDGVLVFDVLEHAENPAALLSEIKRVLKPAGVFYCYVPCEGDWLSIWNLRNKIGAKIDLTEKYAGHINKFSRQELWQLLIDQGFNISRVRYSEHILGQLLGLIVFKMMARMASKQKISQLNNEQFFGQVNKQGGRLLKILKNIVNVLINLESYLLCWMPGANVHVVLINL